MVGWLDRDYTPDARANQSYLSKLLWMASLPLLFQSTLPMKGATIPVPARRMRPLVSIHAPNEGSDPKFGGRGDEPVFQSTLPMKGATGVPSKNLHNVRVSIHAPNEGSDEVIQGFSPAFLQFQSTLPMKGATCDGRGIGGSCVFQSTLPMKGATSQSDYDIADRLVSIHAPNEGSDPPTRGTIRQ